MPPRISSQATCALHKASMRVLEGRARPAVLSQGTWSDAYRPSSPQCRYIMKAPKDGWRLFWNQLPKFNIDPNEIEKLCLHPTCKEAFGAWKPSAYYECAEAFYAAVQKGSSPASTHLLEYPKIDAALIYQTACVVDATYPTLKPFVLAMWTSASSLGYLPARINMAKHLIEVRRFGQLSIFSKVEAEFNKLVAQGKDPNALTVEGLRLWLAKDPTSAAATLQKAVRLSPLDFSYSGLCNLLLGKIANDQGRWKDAAMYLERAYELVPRDAGIYLSDAYVVTEPEKARNILYKAAVLGNTKAWQRLADLELGMALKEKDEATKADHELWGMEFRRLYDYHKAQEVEERARLKARTQ